MPVKSYRPTTPTRRYLKTVDRSTLKSQSTPKKSLAKGVKRAKGRSHGRITTRHKGGGSKRKYRVIDTKLTSVTGPLTILSLEYDPNRTAWIALAQQENGDVTYILATHSMKKGDTILVSDEAIDPKRGNRMPMRFIPEGMEVCAVEFQPGRGAQLATSAGTFVTIQSKDGDRVQVKMASGEVRLFHGDCRATVGRMSNVHHNNQVIGSAGRMRRMGKRPTVRGKAMNPVDHPHGGGEAGTSIGLKHPKTFRGKVAHGRKTRRKNRPSDRVILHRRPSKRRK